MINSKIHFKKGSQEKLQMEKKICHLSKIKIFFGHMLKKKKLLRKALKNKEIITSLRHIIKLLARNIKLTIQTTNLIKDKKLRGKTETIKL